MLSHLKCRSLFRLLTAQAKPGETPAEMALVALEVTVKQTPPHVSSVRAYQQHKFLANILSFIEEHETGGQLCSSKAEWM